MAAQATPASADLGELAAGLLDCASDAMSEDFIDLSEKYLRAAILAVAAKHDVVPDNGDVSGCNPCNNEYKRTRVGCYITHNWSYGPRNRRMLLRLSTKTTVLKSAQSKSSTGPPLMELIRVQVLRYEYDLADNGPTPLTTLAKYLSEEDDLARVTVRDYVGQ